MSVKRPDASAKSGVHAGFVMGHTRMEPGFIRPNSSGDWVEHCTAVGETADGRLTEIDWLKERQQDLPLHVVPVSSGLVTPIRASDVRTGRAA